MANAVSKTESDGTTTVAIPDAYPRIAAMMQRLSLETSVGENDDFRYDIAEIVENILNADTDAELFERQEIGSIASKDYTGKPFYLDKSGITWKRSALDGIFPFYALLRVTDMETGEVRVINTGGATCIAVLDSLVMRGYLDEEKGLMFVEKATASGYSVIMVRPVPTGKRK